jgi:chemotaxis protein methyltransferase CheR
VKDTECVGFLQWALPRLGLRWRGFRRVRGQVCKRIDWRMRYMKRDSNGLPHFHVICGAAAMIR